MYDPTCKIWLMCDDGKRVCVGKAFSVTFCVLSFFCILAHAYRSHLKTDHGSRRVFLRKVVPFKGLDNKNNVWGSTPPPKKNMIF